jgi:hypothetical protein
MRNKIMAKKEFVERKPSKDLPFIKCMIEQFLHCKLCIKEVMAGASDSPRDYSKYSVGWTKQGLQVWCNRHDRNMLHVDFEGIQHPATVKRKPMDYEEEMK